MEVHDNTKKRREFECIRRLYGDSSVYCQVPKSVVFDKELGEQRVTTFAYFALSCGRWERVGYCLNDIVEWTKRKPSRNANKVNSHICDCIEKLRDKEFLYDVGKISHASFSCASFDSKRVSDECQSERYAVLYLDELTKVFEFFASKSKDAYANIDTVLLVFAYLRTMIYRRQNALFIDEYDTEYRKAKYPEVYNAYYIDIAEDIGIPVRSVSRIVGVLEELGLIHSETLSRVKEKDNWFTRHVLLCNAYKREGDELVAEGAEYYNKEIENKMKILERMGDGVLLRRAYGANVQDESE